MDLDDIAGELYALPPTAFTAARDARAAEARRDGDRALAAAVTKLRKPSRSAWLANVLARDRPEDVARLAELGPAIADAHERLDGDALRRLARERHQMIEALGTEARGVARSRGQDVTEAMVAELEDTLESAVADARAADALRSGRLTTALRHAGIGFPDPASGGPSSTSTPSPEGSSPTSRRSRRGEDARAVQTAERQTERTRRALEARSRAVQRAEQELEKVEGDVRAAEAALSVLEERVEEARRKVAEARRDRETAAAVHERAARALDALRPQG